MVHRLFQRLCQVHKIKLNTLLLGVFLFTILSATSAITIFSYSKYRQSIKTLSKSLISVAGKSIIAQINCLIEQFEKLTEIGAELFLQKSGSIQENQALISFFLTETKQNPQLISYFAGTPNGDYAVCIDFTLSPSTPKKMGVPNALYALFISEGTDSEKQIFYDQNLQMLDTRTGPRNYDILTRPWYVGAEKTGNLYWTQAYSYITTPDVTGISAALPVYNAQKQLLGVIGADLDSNVFSRFIEQQVISQHGIALILSEQGDILLPQEQKKGRFAPLAHEAFNIFTKTKETDFTFQLGKGEKFLASLHPLKDSFNNRWIVAMMAPRADFFSTILQAQRLAILFTLIVLSLASAFIAYLAYRISKPITTLSEEIDQIAKLELQDEPRIASPILELHLIDSSISSMRTALRSFARYIPHEIAKELMHTTHEITLGGVKKELTIFFTDIANFTSIAEGLPIETVNTLLADHFDTLSKVILECGGLIDKYIGDSIMSLWGALTDIPDRSNRACKAALLCQVRLLELNAKQKKQGMPEFITRMGIHSGPVILGNFGTEHRMNFTAIGDTVNTAARLQTLNKNYGTKILISETVATEIGDQFLIRPLQMVEVRGKKNKIKIFELLGELKGDPLLAPTQEQIELCKAFTEAYLLHEQGNFKLAKEKFLKIQEKFPDDLPTKTYTETT